MKFSKSSTELFTNNWKLIHDKNNVGKNQKWYEAGIPAEGAVDAEVPSFVHMYLGDCFGVSWYERKFETELRTDADHIFLLKFEMADFLCEVYLNGQLAGTHRGNEDPFEFDVTGLIRFDDKNLLSVRISKPWTEDVDGYSFKEIPHRNEHPTGLMPGACYNEYGLPGNVELCVVPKLRITDAFVNGNMKTNSVDIVYTIRNDYEHAVAATLETACGDKRTGREEAEDTYKTELLPGDAVVNRSIQLNDVRLWSTDDPNLYFVNMRLSGEKSVDRLCKHCGFRTFEVKADGFFYLNDKRVFLKCSHTGNTMPESTLHLSRDKNLLRRDFILAKAANMNAVRFIAGCALPEQLDYCDEIGLMVYEEPMASWLLGDGPMEKEIYEHDLYTMIKRDRSHPCVVIWGLLNETGHGVYYDIARQSLCGLRDFDETRLVLFSSGRWDMNASWGSVCNPYSREWECLWNKESPDAGKCKWVKGDWCALVENVGDIHFYPRIPYAKEAVDIIRKAGCDVRRPVFLSEFGVGSLFDVIWLSRKFEEWDSNPEYPDVKMVRRMASKFLSELKRYGFEDEYAFPVDIMRESQRKHSRQRAISFNLVRSNPYMAGYNITGLLDHSICGEGLWTLMREWKYGLADVMEKGFAPLKWCLFVEPTHIYSGTKFVIEGVLANENILKEKSYPIGIRISGPSGVVYSETMTLNVTAENLKLLAVPVFKKEISLDVPTGEYELHAEILEGAAATDGESKFFVTDYSDIKATVDKIAVCGVGAAVSKLLADKGVKTVDLFDVRDDEKIFILTGEIEADIREAAWGKIKRLLVNGSRVFAASCFSFEKDGDFSYYMPLGKKTVAPSKRERSDDLYHDEYLFKKAHPYFKNLPAGMADFEYYIYLISSYHFECEDRALPDEVQSVRIGPGRIGGIPEIGGYVGGFTMGTYQIGKGALTINAYNIIENVSVNPAADCLLINILNTESEKLGK